ncbi:MAG: hydrogenase expression/formation protein HypE, partial [Clostridia bacterium]|nr:hydrogenase expression/formation protein HypE [Clostridia bacterium]
MDEILLSHGAGGRDYRRLVEEVFLPAYGSAQLASLSDAAVCETDGPVAFTTDGFVVNPLFFPGGDIGSLSVSGTVNDLAVAGAKPLYLSVGMILEAGFPIPVLRKIAESIARTAREAGVSVVTGDTKVVEKGKGEGIYITTAGIGTCQGRPHVPQNVCPGDAIVVSAPIASHGMAVMAAREKLEIDPVPVSDARPLNHMISRVLDGGIAVHAMRDPTRGGVGATLCEWAGPGIDLLVEEERLPMLGNVRALCELMGMDPLYAANEGVCLFAVPGEEAGKTVEILRTHPYGREACCIGSAAEGCGDVI